MSIRVQWDQDTTVPIIVFNFEGDWSWHECREAMQYAEFLAEDNENSFHYVYDLTMNRLPQRQYLAHIQKMLLVKSSPRLRSITVIERGHFVETLKDFLMAAKPHANLDNIYFAETLARARARILTESAAE